MKYEDWLSARSQTVEISGVRQVFELARSLPNPINLSIGQPHFDVPEPLKNAAKAAIDAGHNGYTVTQGIPELLAALQADVQVRFPGQNRAVLVTSGTSGGLLLALLAAIDPGDEVIIPDPYFVAYPQLVRLVGGSVVIVDTYDDFRLDLNRLNDAITPRTKAILLSTPANPTGVVLDTTTQRELAALCQRRGVLLISDEIYRAFHYDAPPTSPAQYNPEVLVIEGFGKSYGMTGWRLGWTHGPQPLIQTMTKLQQFTFVCAPSIVQYAGVAAMNYDVSAMIADYKRKRDFLVDALKNDYEFVIPGGAFYLFPKAPRATATEFVRQALQHQLLMIPGNVFSRRDTHFRISYAASDETLHRGIAVLRQLARQ
ncbi:MAG: aminotransferase class I/II-fold pyridoxal phosphate-dependent enzyme [Gemmataceae bacterium]|nr:aminotransferase class I/II-fold pyridoxal phosphate-dependent enzyme [Gemmata sp.]MDW8197143.1 aminotransferase class I/II-fold pyridoxal phosphate-dependent enzyme [Gemmataceae bacterium]